MARGLQKPDEMKGLFQRVWISARLHCYVDLLKVGMYLEHLRGRICWFWYRAKFRDPKFENPNIKVLKNMMLYVLKHDKEKNNLRIISKPSKYNKPKKYAIYYAWKSKIYLIQWIVRLSKQISVSTTFVRW